MIKQKSKFIRLYLHKELTDLLCEYPKRGPNFSFGQAASLRCGPCVSEAFKRTFVCPAMLHATCGASAADSTLSNDGNPSHAHFPRHGLFFISEKLISQEIMEMILSMFHVSFRMFSYLSSIITPFTFLSLTSF